MNRYPNHDKSYELLKEGIEKGVFQPQFHGREHLNVLKWLRLLQAGNSDMLLAFEKEMFSVKVEGERVLPAFNIENEGDASFITRSIIEGLEMFESLFGFKSLSIIAPCYTWDNWVENTASEKGVRYIQGGFQQKHSKIAPTRFSSHYLGQKNNNGQTYLTRNCLFEPSQDKKYDGNCCFKEIKQHLKRGIPAIVSCHRLNFIGALDEDNRTKNLEDFACLLKQIINEFPDVEFLSSDQLGLVLEDV